MNSEQINRLAQIEKTCPSYANITRKAYSGKSKAAALKAKCLDCSCWLRAEIRNCTVLACPLHPYRPYQTDNEPDDSIPTDTTETTVIADQPPANSPKFHKSTQPVVRLNNQTT